MSEEHLGKDKILFRNVSTHMEKSKNKAMNNEQELNRNWSNQKPNPALKTKMGNK